MENAKVRYLSLILAFVVISGCKSEDDKMEDAAAAQDPISESAPAIWGKPVTDVLVNSQYIFAPEASDADGDVLEFSIVNKPAWAEFDSLSGKLQGIPGSDDVGAAGDIVISVSDTSSVVSLPGFAVTVNAIPVQDDGSGGDAASAPPTISGSPNQAVVAGDVYTFQPVSTDPEGDALSFSIVNKPSWATFDTATGRLEGTPTASDLGRTDSIEVSVTDGASIAALSPFDISVEATGSTSYSVAWIAPTQNEDGTPLTDLAGYRIYYGTSTGSYSKTIEINSAGMTSYMIGNMVPGNYYLVMTSIDSQNMESRYTAELEFQPGT